MGLEGFEHRKQAQPAWVLFALKAAGTARRPEQPQVRQKLASSSRVKCFYQTEKRQAPWPRDTFLEVEIERALASTVEKSLEVTVTLNLLCFISYL